MLALYALGLGVGTLVILALGERDDDAPDGGSPPTKPGGVDLGKPPPTTTTPGPTTPEPGGGPQAVTWDVATWGGGSQPMKWIAIRFALWASGFDVVPTLNADVNGPGCPAPGKGSRSGCTPAAAVSQFQSTWNKVVTRAKGGAPFEGSQLFEVGQPLAVDGILGANTLRALSVVRKWQEQHGGLGPGKFKALAQ